MSKDLGASDEDLIQKSDEESDPKASFFDNTIDESENDNTVVQSMPMEESKKAPVESQGPDAGQSDKNVFAENGNKSFMEIEVKKDKMRWLYMSELGAIFGEEKHTREGFIKVFGNRVSESDKILIKYIFFDKSLEENFRKKSKKKV